LLNNENKQNIVMKARMLNLLLAGLVALWACSSPGGSDEPKSGIYEPGTQQQFVQILDELGIKPYPGAEISKFTHLTDATLAYKVPAEGNTNKAILTYYKQALAQAFKDKEEWHRFSDNPLSVVYMKGFDLSMTVTLTSKNAAREMAGDLTDVPRFLKFEITLGDGADAY